MRATADHGTTVSDECPVSMLAFRCEWIVKRNIQPGMVSAIEIKKDSTEPGLRNGDTIFIDHARKQVRRDAVATTRVSDDLFVKCLKNAR